MLKKLLSIVLAAALLATACSLPALAGSWATYDGTQFTTPDGWTLQKFSVNKEKTPILAYTEVPTALYLTNIWKQNGETVDNIPDEDNGWEFPVEVPPGTFKWKIEDKSVVRMEDYEIGALLYGLKEGKTTITVTGPNGKISRSEVIVMDEGTTATGGTAYPDSFIVNDDWPLTSFNIGLNGEFPVLSTQVCTVDVATLQVHMSLYRQIGTMMPETMSGFFNFAPEEFSWSVSDESIAVLRDDYPGTNAISLVWLKEGIVTVTLTGPQGKQAFRRLYGLPEDEFGGEDTGGGKPPVFNEPVPPSDGIKIGQFISDVLLLGWLKPLFQPLIDLIVEADETGQAEEWLKGLGEAIIALLFPVEAAVQATRSAVAGLQGAATASPDPNESNSFLDIIRSFLEILYNIFIKWWWEPLKALFNRDSTGTLTLTNKTNVENKKYTYGNSSVAVTGIITSTNGNITKVRAEIWQGSTLNFFATETPNKIEYDMKAMDRDLKFSQLTAGNYRFSVKATNADGEVTLQDDPFTVVATTITFEYSGNGSTSGSVPTPHSIITSNSTNFITIKQPGTLARTGYRFGGWRRGSEICTAGATIGFPRGASGTSIFYATWVSTSTASGHNASRHGGWWYPYAVVPMNEGILFEDTSVNLSQWLSAISLSLVNWHNSSANISISTLPTSTNRVKVVSEPWNFDVGWVIPIGVSGNQLTQFEIVLNAHQISNSKLYAVIDYLKHTTAHEFGHVVGLLDNPTGAGTTSSVMNYSDCKMVPTQFDVNSVNLLYR